MEEEAEAEDVWRGLQQQWEREAWPRCVSRPVVVAGEEESSDAASAVSGESGGGMGRAWSMTDNDLEELKGCVDLSSRAAEVVHKLVEKTTQRGGERHGGEGIPHRLASLRPLGQAREKRKSFSFPRARPRGALGSVRGWLPSPSMQSNSPYCTPRASWPSWARQTNAP